MKTPTSKLSVQSAFSLVELLVVIAVIAVIAAIAIPNIANITGSATSATKLRNAQNLSTTWNSYVTTLEGSGGTAPTNVSIATALTVLTANSGAGTAVTNSRLGGVVNTFSLGNLQAADIDTNAIQVSGNMLQFANTNN